MISMFIRRIVAPFLPAVAAVAATVLAGCSSAAPPNQGFGAVPMPSGISCGRNAAGYAENCNPR